MGALRMWWAMHGPQHFEEDVLAVCSFLVLPAASLAAGDHGFLSVYGMIAGALVLPFVMWLRIADLRERRGAGLPRIRL